jgi:hypothetical protein
VIFAADSNPSSAGSEAITDDPGPQTVHDLSVPGPVRVGSGQRRSSVQRGTRSELRRYVRLCLRVNIFI